MTEPGRHVQTPVRVLLRVGFRGGQLGTADGELHTRLLIGQLLDGGNQTKKTGGRSQRQQQSMKPSNLQRRKTFLRGSCRTKH